MTRQTRERPHAAPQGDPMKTNEESAACALSRASASALAGLTLARLCPRPVPQPRMASVPVLPGMVNS